MPLVYFILGTPGSTRQVLVADLVENGLSEKEKAMILHAEGDAVEVTGVSGTTWQWEEGAIVAALDAGATHVFFFADPRRNPVDQMEALVTWLPGANAKIGRVFTVVDCRLGQANPLMMPWYEACVHFSDVVFMENRTDVPGGWISEFEKHFKKQHFPCLFELPRNGEVGNPALVLETLALRMAPIFEDDFSLTPGSEYSTDFDDDEEDDDVDAEQDQPLEDPYFARNRGGGNRVIDVPDITPFLPKAG